jgi:hypothetical protein
MLGVLTVKVVELVLGRALKLTVAVLFPVMIE